MPVTIKYPPITVPDRLIEDLAKYSEEHPWYDKKNAVGTSLAHQIVCELMRLLNDAAGVDNHGHYIKRED